MDNLPEAMRTPEIEEAMGILQEISQDDAQWNHYLECEKPRLESLHWQKLLEAAKAEALKARAEAAEAVEARGLIGQLRLCEEFLELAPLPEEQLRSMSVEHLKELLAERRGRKRR